jgi:AraC-like DNA-binding protein
MDTTHSYRELAQHCAIAEPVRVEERRSPDLAAPERALALRPGIGTRAMALEVRDFPRARDLPVDLNPVHVLVLIVVRGSANLRAENGASELSPGHAFLIADGKYATVRWADQSRGVYLWIPRADLQARASAILAEPRRLAAINLRLSTASQITRHLCLPDWLGEDVRFAANVLRLAIDTEAGEALLTALIGELREVAPLDGTLPVARAVKCAVDYIHAQSGADCSPDRLARIAGVTPATLTKSFKACLGISIKNYLSGIRLDVARSCLESEHDSRSIGEIAMSIGFDHASGLSRSYQERFKETPSQTRANARQHWRLGSGRS